MDQVTSDPKAQACFIWITNYFSGGWSCVLYTTFPKSFSTL